jgi:hypothetical protein
MGCGAVIAFVALDFADLDHLGGAIRASVSIIIIEKNRNSNVLDLERDIFGLVCLSHIWGKQVELPRARIDDLEILRLDRSPAAIELPSAASRLLAQLCLHVIRRTATALNRLTLKLQISRWLWVLFTIILFMIFICGVFIHRIHY